MAPARLTAGCSPPDQMAGGTDEAANGQPPNRGVIQCKTPKDDVIAIADTAQVSDYWNRYNKVLVTNYREFLLLGRDEGGNPVTHEYYRLAALNFILAF
jgi:hypothetical protein